METCPRRNWICSNSPPAAWHRRAQVRRRSCGANFSNPICFAESFTMCQTAFSVMPSPRIRPHFRHSTEDLTSVDPRSIQPDSQLFHYPTGDRNRANMSRLAPQIDNSPVFLPLFQILESEINGFVATQTAGKQQRKKCTVSLALERLTVRGLP